MITTLIPPGHQTSLEKTSGLRLCGILENHTATSGLRLCGIIDNHTATSRASSFSGSPNLRIEVVRHMDNHTAIRGTRLCGIFDNHTVTGGLRLCGIIDTHTSTPRASSYSGRPDLRIEVVQHVASHTDTRGLRVRGIIDDHTEASWSKAKGKAKQRSKRTL